MNKIIQILLACLVTCIVTAFVCADLSGQVMKLQEDKAAIHANDTANFWRERYLKCNGEIKRDVEFLQSLGK